MFTVSLMLQKRCRISFAAQEFPDTHYPFSVENIMSFADTEFVSFIKNNDYYFSQKLLEEENKHWMFLLSENENRVYFLFLD